MSLSGRSRVSSCSRRSLVGAASAWPRLTSWPRPDVSCWPRGSSGPKSRRSTSSDRERSASSNVTLSAPPPPCRSEQLSSRPTTIPRPWNSSRSIEFSLGPPRSRASESSGPSSPWQKCRFTRPGNQTSRRAPGWCRRRVARPYPDDRLLDPRPQGTEEGPEHNCAALKRPWSANPEEAPHPETEIECTGVHEQSLQDVLLAVDVRATQATGFVEMRAGAFEQFAASAKEAFAARSRSAR